LYFTSLLLLLTAKPAVCCNSYRCCLATMCYMWGETCTSIRVWCRVQKRIFFKIQPGGFWGFWVLLGFSHFL